ncbi:MAG: DJ-1/PfpI family protein [Piscirickettsiaceae bacterium]|nr:DJ-1/PfpI family protein [Piscirickettsiaceae bacterium]
MPTVLIPLAEGCEALEAVTLIDLLRRADITVVTASLGSQTITASQGVHLTADTRLENVLYDNFDMIILPGGMPGTTHLNGDPHIHAILKRLHQSNKAIAAICAAPLVLATAGLLDDKKATCYPGVLDAKQWPNIHLSNDAVVIDGEILTSKGPGTAMDFALAIIEYLTDHTTRHTVEIELVRPA